MFSVATALGLAKMQLRNLSGKMWCEARARRPFVRSVADVCFCALGGTSATRGLDLCTSLAHAINNAWLLGPGPQSAFPWVPESDRTSLLMGVNNLGERIFRLQSSLQSWDDGRSQHITTVTAASRAAVKRPRSPRHTPVLTVGLPTLWPTSCCPQGLQVGVLSQGTVPGS